MERLTEPYGPDYFRVRGNKTVYNRNPSKSSHISCALARLFQYENLGLMPEEMRHIKEDYDSLN